MNRIEKRMKKMAAPNDFEKKSKELKDLLDEINRFMKSKEQKVKQLMKELEGYF